MKRLVYTISFLLIACSAFTQDLTDALRYSNYHISGTARSAAMGNAFGALGGDFSSLSINPAGVGVYRAGEFTITPSLGQSNVDGTYLGNTVSDSKYNISLDNIGYVANFNLGENSESGLVSVNVGLGFNKLGSFTMSSLAEGFNSNHSLLAYFTENANNSGLSSSQLDPYYERLAWNTDLLLYDNDKKEYFNDITDSNYGQAQRSTIDRRGYINEYLLSVAANFNHRFYFGATLGIHDVYYKENADLYEWDEQGNTPYFNNFNFNTYLKTAGNGVNLKLGAILRPIDQLRLGFAFHSPTFYKLNDLYDSGMRSSITYDDGATEETPASPDKQGVYDYEIETPMKLIASGALVIGKAGLVSVDYEFVDYSTAKIKNGSDGYNYFGENQTIKNAYKSVGNLHLGAELKLDPNFSIRGGYEYFPSVYKKSYLNQNNPNLDASYSTFSGGFGYRQGGVFFDVAYRRLVNEEYAKLYPGAINMAQYETSKNNLMFTLGFRF
jgi:hypothetical protein